MKAKFVEEITVKDPDTGGDVVLEVYKHENGGIFAIDSSYLDQVSDTITDPFANKFVKLILTGGV